MLFPVAKLATLAFARHAALAGVRIGRRLGQGGLPPDSLADAFCSSRPCIQAFPQHSGLAHESDTGVGLLRAVAARRATRARGSLLFASTGTHLAVESANKLIDRGRTVDFPESFEGLCQSPHLLR